MKVTHEMDCPEWKSGKTDLCECVKKELTRLHIKIQEIEDDRKELLSKIWSTKKEK